MPDGFDFTIGQNDDQVLWSFPVFDAFGNQLDPTGGTGSILWRIDDNSAPEQTLTAIPVIQPAGAAWLGHTFVAAELAAPGVYLAVAVFTVAGVRRTWPTSRKMRVLVQAVP